MSRVAHELAAATARLHEVLLVCPGYANEVSIPGEGKACFAQVASFGQGDVLLPDLRIRNRRWLDAVLTDFQPDVIHAQDFGPVALRIQDWARQARLPYLATLHYLPSRTQAFVSREVNGLAFRVGAGSLYRAFVSKFLNLCDGVIALNHAVANDLKAFGYKGSTYDVPNGRNLADFTSLQIADPSQVDKQLLYIGAFGLRKNQRFLLEMLSHLSLPAKLELIGDTPEPIYLQLLKQYASDHGLSRVAFTGKVPFEQIPFHLQQAHVFVSASTLEVQSLAVIEALASGTPVVGLANDTTNELLDDTVGCCLPANATPEEFARKVDTICNLPATEYVAMCWAARERVRHLDWQNVIELNTAVYKDLADRKRSTPVSGRHPAPVWTPWLAALSTAAWGWHDLTTLRNKPTTASLP